MKKFIKNLIILSLGIFFTASIAHALTISIVPQGGTGVGTLTGLVKGNGTSAFSAAISGTDYLPITGGTGITTLGTITTGVWNGTAITNANLANSSITIGSTNISLGATSTTLAGLTSTTSTTFFGALTGNATTATALQTPRNINGTAFDGTADITVTAAAGTLTGTTLNSSVVTSSLTSVGTLTGLTLNSSTVTLSQDTNFVLSGGVNGVSFDTTTLSVDATNHRVGIGTAAPSNTLDIVGGLKASPTPGSTANVSVFGNMGASTFTSPAATDSLWAVNSATTGGLRSFIAEASFTGSGNSANTYQGINAAATTSAGSTGNLTATASGALRNRYLIAHNGSGTVTMASAITGVVNTAALGPITDSAVFNAESPAVGTGITNNSHSGLWVRGGAISGTITTRYGVRIDTLTGGTTKYGIFVQSDPTSLGGTLSVTGTTTLATSLTGVLRADSGVVSVDATVVSGTYTPTATNVTNITSSTPNNATYTRVGNVVSVNGTITVTETLAVASQVDISLPVASNLGAATDLNGVATMDSTASVNMYIKGDATNDRASIFFTAAGVGQTSTIYYHFSYTVI